MDIETIREYCLGLPCTTEDSAFGEGYLLFRVCDKILHVSDLTTPTILYSNATLSMHANSETAMPK